ncbi:hypothetical protein V9654_003111 [Vibrio parahaemolyticus]|uniref:HNH endonuclease n=1 Tax=Vibrio parahaemolyticus TaxID=670 RepID=UPI00111F3D5A|nr:HNH endonuclease domain-containing protein [Vibrio parahaemolyticus]EHH2454507.1 hypothetical protein [Vibrio parahaemolyticus]EJS9607742.1 hypothetical protein [Vibrio parahaemolyticus]ELB2252052.1 hypothetical protein [Vibrio parahaemolyticus]EMB2740872.1 hypothetical protein [Vibrio parahaemolyticus]MBE4134651.1 hypothetical protein [Vibrio parahaemolyticus]
MNTSSHSIKIENAYTLTASEKTLINEWEKAGTCSADDWNDVKFSSLKSNMKSHYIKEQNNRCCYCLQEIKSDRHDLWDLEHIVPRCEKPAFMFEPLNLCISCKDCNQRKHKYVPLVNVKVVKVPQRSNKYKMVHSHLDDYKDHITCTYPGDFYKARDKKGEETINKCGLLRFHAVGDRDIPDLEIDDLARGVITSSNDISREVLEKALLDRLIAKYQNTTNEQIT